jgi:hypothetical protein
MGDGLYMTIIRVNAKGDILCRNFDTIEARDAYEREHADELSELRKKHKRDNSPEGWALRGWTMPDWAR